MVQYPVPFDNSTQNVQPNGKHTTVEQSRVKPTKGKPHQPHYELKDDDPTIAKYFIEVFSGTAVLASKAQQSGAIVYTFDEQNGKKGDILHKATFKDLARLASSPNCIGLWCGMPCETFSAVRRSNKKGPPPLREWNNPMKPLDNLTNDQWNQFTTANRILNAMVKLIKTCTRHNTRWYIENGIESDLWRCAPIKELMEMKDARTSQFDYCQYGTPYMKPTRILCWRNIHFELQQKRCGMSQHNNHRGKATGQRHKQLIGKNEKAEYNKRQQQQRIHIT